MSNPVFEDKQDRALQLGEHSGGFYFKRAFLTSFAVLVAVSAFLTMWALFWFLVIGGINAANNEASNQPSGYTCTPEPDQYDC